METWESFVEAEIRLICADSLHKQVRIELIYAGGAAAVTILATGVDDFFVSEMRLSNVVDRVCVFGVDDADEPMVVENLLFLMQGGLADGVGHDWPPLQEKLKAMRDGGLIMLAMEPVYGARVLLLAKSIDVL